jgi:hypothetical protein
VLKLSEKEAAKHIAASMVTPNVATALARCPKECILSRLRSLPYRAAAAEIAGPASAAAAPSPSSCRGGAGDFTAVSFPLSSFPREVLTEEREVGPFRSPLTGWDPPVGESRESDMARADWSTHVTEEGLSQSRVRVHVGHKWTYSGPFVRVDPGSLQNLPFGHGRPGLARQ